MPSKQELGERMMTSGRWKISTRSARYTESEASDQAHWLGTTAKAEFPPSSPCSSYLGQESTFQKMEEIDVLPRENHGEVQCVNGAGMLCLWSVDVQWKCLFQCSAEMPRC